MRAPEIGRQAVAAVLVLALAAVAGCGDDEDGGGGGGGDGGDGAQIALLLPETKTTRYEEQDRPNFERRVRELCADCEIIYANANQDVARQQQQAEAAITQGADAMVISAVDVQSAGALVERAQQSDVPVIAYGRLIPDAPIDHYVSIDPFEVGRQQAQVQLEALERANIDGPRIVMINGAPTDSNAKPYKDGARQAFEQAGAEIVRSFDTPDWSPDEAQREMEQATTALGRDGFDAQLMTVYQPLIDIAESAAELAVAAARDEEPPAGLAEAEVDNGSGRIPSVLLETIAIQEDNIRETVVEDGFHSIDEICVQRYRTACEDAGLR